MDRGKVALHGGRVKRPATTEASTSHVGRVCDCGRARHQHGSTGPAAASSAAAGRDIPPDQARFGGRRRDLQAYNPLSPTASTEPMPPIIVVVVEGAAPASPPPKPSSLRREITREQQASAAVAPQPASDAEAGPPQHRRRYRRRGHPPPGNADAGAASSLPPDARAHVQRVLDESPRCRTDRSVPREYCAQMPAASLEEGLVNLLRTLMRFQQRQVHRKPTMAKARRRLLLGLRQCLRASHTGHLKALVLATNLEAYGASAYFSMIVTFCASFLSRDAPVWILVCLSRAGQCGRRTSGCV